MHLFMIITSYINHHKLISVVGTSSWKLEKHAYHLK